LGPVYSSHPTLAARVSTSRSCQLRTHPQVNRVAVLRDPALTAGVGQFAVIQSVAPSVGMEVTAIGLRDASDIERAVAKFATVPNGGLILTASALSVLHHGLVVALAARFKLPTIYYRRFFVNAGGLVSYGYDVVEHFRGAGQRRRHTFICSECHGTERRVVFIKDGREADAPPLPIQAAPRIKRASTVQDEHVAAPGLFGRVMARLRGQ
jgi:hypothetical protein